MPREPDWDELCDAAEERRRMRPQRCVCDPGGQMPGRCPGPHACPYSGIDAGEEEEDDDA